MVGKSRGGFELPKGTNTAVSTAYDATATFGRVATIIKTIIFNLILVIFLSIGIFLVLKKDSRTAKTMAKIAEVKCSRERNSLMCDGTLEYKVNGETYEKEFSTQSRVSKGQRKEVRYDPENPEDFSLNSSARFIGWIMIGVCLLLLIISWIWLWFVLKYKLAAAAAGVGTAAEMIIPNGTSSSDMGSSTDISTLSE